MPPPTSGRAKKTSETHGWVLATMMYRENFELTKLHQEDNNTSVQRATTKPSCFLLLSRGYVEGMICRRCFTHAY
jgi:hypothetical protein